MTHLHMQEIFVLFQPGLQLPPTRDHIRAESTLVVLRDDPEVDHHDTFMPTSPVFLIRQLTTLYSGHDLSRPSGITKLSITLLVMWLSIISGYKILPPYAG
jgi:hypothetical protein